ncbi:MAG: LysM peptidoglycan-binding domain-containing protein [Phycisphaerae bacterium]
MRRIALSLLMVIAGVSMGCQKAKPTAEPIQSAEADYGTLQPDLYVTDSGDIQPYQAPAPYREPAYADTGYASFAGTPDSLALTASPGSTHTVANGDTLYGLARRYYGDASRWKDIYEANRDVLRSPDVLLVGQELDIP